MRDEHAGEAARQRIVSGFTPSAEEGSEARVLAGVHRFVRAREVRGRRLVLSVSLAATLVASLAVAYPLVVSLRTGKVSETPISRWPDYPGVPEMIGKENVHGLILIPGGMGGFLARPPERWKTVAEARKHLVFEPVLPQRLPPGTALGLLYTCREEDGYTDAPGDTSFVASYEGGLQVLEKQWDRSLVRDPASFRKFVAAYPSHSGGRLVREVTVSDTTFSMWRLVKNRPNFRKARITQVRNEVRWYRDGIGYVLASPNHSPEQLLSVAESMIR